MTDMSEAIKQLQELQAQLGELHVTVEQVEQIKDVVAAYIEAKEAIMRNRDTQFDDDAYSFLIDIKAASDKNRLVLARFLRSFAEHVVQYALSLQADGIIAAPDIVDHVPNMTTQEPL